MGLMMASVIMSSKWDKEKAMSGKPVYITDAQVINYNELRNRVDTIVRK